MALRRRTGPEVRPPPVGALVGLACLLTLFSTTSQHSYAEGGAVERAVEQPLGTTSVVGLRLPVEPAQEVGVVVGAEGPRA